MRQMDQRFFDAVEDNPIIAAIKGPEDLKECCSIPEIRDCFYSVWRHLFSERNRKDNKGCRQDCHGPCGSDQWSQHKRDCGRFCPYRYRGRRDHHHQTGADQTGKRVVHVSIQSLGYSFWILWHMKISAVSSTV